MADDDDLISINSTTMTIQQCFTRCLYVVPGFQRPYSWRDEQLGDYWEDVVLARSDFFFGSTVTWVSEKRPLFNNSFSIIDGQQRLTTSSIALSVVRDYFARLQDSLTADGQTNGLAAQVSATQKYLVAVDDEGTEYPVLRRPEPMFWEVIQKPSAIPSGALWDHSAQLVGVARTFFEDQIGALLADENNDDSRIAALKQVRSNILQARVVQVELMSEEDAFLIFETLNTRGADLLLASIFLARPGSGCSGWVAVSGGLLSAVG